MKIGIIGNGFVGNATKQLKCNDISTIMFDINPELCEPKGISLEDLLICEIIFICVPTPMKENGECYLDIVNKVVKQLNDLKFKNFIVIRSTVPIGTSDRLNTYFMPEFLTEKNYIVDFINNKNWIFGLLDKDKERDLLFKKYIENLFFLARKSERIKYNNVNFVLNKEAELIKLFRNCFLATKVSFCNEICEFCEKNDINYNNVRELAASDDRILHSHTYVPGHDGKKGFGGTCFPKDINSLLHQMKNSNVNSYVLSSVIERNENVDRKAKDWELNKGRAVVSSD